MIVGMKELKLAENATESYELSTGRTFVLSRIKASDDIEMDKRMNYTPKDGFVPAVAHGLEKCFVKSIEKDGTENLRDEAETPKNYEDGVQDMDTAEVTELFSVFVEHRGLGRAQGQVMAEGFRQRKGNSTP